MGDTTHNCYTVHWIGVGCVACFQAGQQASWMQDYVVIRLRLFWPLGRGSRQGLAG